MTAREAFNIDELTANPDSSAQSVFQYIPRDSFIHDLNPVTKIVLSLSMIGMAFLFPTYHGALVLAMLLTGLMIYARVFWQIGKIVATVGAPLVVSLVLVQGLFYPANATPFFRLPALPLLGPVIFWEEGLRFSLLILSRLYVFMISLLLSIVTTHPKKLTIALAEKGMPIKFSYVFLSAIQFIPQMQDRARAILEAQQARGLDTDANILRRAKSFIPLMSPLLISMLISAQTRALALESRGFTRSGHKTSLYEVRDNTLDRGLRWFSIGAVLLVALWRVTQWL